MLHCFELKYALTVGHFGPRSTDKKVIGLDVTIDQILVVNGLHTRDLPRACQRRSTARMGGDRVPSVAQPCTPS